MKKIALISLLMAPLLIRSQVFKLNAGTSLSLIKVNIPGQYIPNTMQNAVMGFSGTIGLDFAETKHTFLSGNIGLVQRGRKDKVADNFGNPSDRTVKRSYTYGTANITINVKLANKGLIPFLSAGPRLDYLAFQNELSTFDDLSFGFNGGFGLKKKLQKIELGGRVDYLQSFSDAPKSSTATVMIFAGFKLGKK